MLNMYKPRIWSCQVYLTRFSICIPVSLIFYLFFLGLGCNGVASGIIIRVSISCLAFARSLLLRGNGSRHRPTICIIDLNIFPPEGKITSLENRFQVVDFFQIIIFLIKLPTDIVHFQNIFHFSTMILHFISKNRITMRRIWLIIMIKNRRW